LLPQLLLSDLQRNDAQFRANRARYIEVPDEQGNTPLTLAAARGHLACVNLVSRNRCKPADLLARRASINSAVGAAGTAWAPLMHCCGVVM
jgi:ankyrin repeat protein